MAEQARDGDRAECGLGAAWPGPHDRGMKTLLKSALSLVLPSIWSSIPSCAASPSDSAAPCEKASSNKSPSMARMLRNSECRADWLRTFVLSGPVSAFAFAFACSAAATAASSASSANSGVRPARPVQRNATHTRARTARIGSATCSHECKRQGRHIRGTERVTHAPAFAAAYCPKNWPSFSSTSSAFLLSSPTYAHNAASAASASACDCRRSAAFCECSQSPVDGWGRT